jgi:hypothetical protein
MWPSCALLATTQGLEVRVAAGPGIYRKMAADEAPRCGKRLREMAGDPRFNGRVHGPRSLAEAVSDVVDGSWTGIELLPAFWPASTVFITHSVGAESWLDAAAGISVSRPVAWELVELPQGDRGLRNGACVAGEGGPYMFGALDDRIR